MGKRAEKVRLVLGCTVLVVLAWTGRAPALDYYYYGDRPVILHRDLSLIGVDFAAGTDVVAVQGFRSSDGLVVVEEIVAELPRSGRFVCRIEGQPAAGDATAVGQSLARDPRVQRTYPVFRNPKNGLLILVFDEIILRVLPEVGPGDLLRFGAARGIQIVERNTDEPDIFLLRVGPQGGSALDAANEYARSGLCLWAEPNFGGQVLKFAAPNDPYFYKQWHLNNTGQTGGTPDADVDAPEAWAITSGSAQVVIASLDDGCDLAHEDLAANIFVNAGESGGGRETNGIDDDGNGYVDDVHGWDFFDNDNNPDHSFRSGELEGHGTATAGIAAAVGNNGVGVAGIAYGCRILPVKVFKGNDFTEYYRAADGIRYAAKMADVLSNSWGGGPQSEALEAAFRWAVEKGGRSRRGCPIFFASGNDSVSDVSYPGSSLWTIAVGASDAGDRRFLYSNYGSRLTILSPSGNYTTDISGYGAGYDNGSPDTTGNYTGIFGGTSSACPLAAGIAALLLSVNPNLSAIEIQAILQATADKVRPSVAQYNSYGFSWEYGYGRANAYQALDRVRQGVALDDSFEPNDSLAAARLIDKGFYSGLAALDDDWYAVDVQPYQDISGQIYFMHPLGDLQLTLYNPSGLVVASSTGTTNTEQIEFNTGAAGGCWCFRVFGKSGAKNYYHLTLNIHLPDDTFEPNDSLAAAARIGPGDYNLRGYDPDYFRVRVRSGERITALIRFYHELGDLDFYLMDSTGTLLSESATTRDAEGVWYRNTGPDTDLYLLIDNFGGCENTYQLHVEVGPGQDDVFEQNDTSPTAALVLPGSYRRLQPYDNDWYKVAVGPRQILETEIRFFNAVGNLDLEVYDAAGQWVDRSVGGADAERVVFINTGNTATYAYPLVYTYGTDYPDYDLSVILRPLADDAFEQNNDQSHAAAIPIGVQGNLVALDNDFFSVEVPVGKTLAAIVADEKSLPSLGLEIYAPSGAQLATAPAGQPKVVVARQAPVTGAYRLGVRLPPGGKANLYALGTFVYDAPTTPTETEDRFEPNDSRVRGSTPVAQGVYSNLFCGNDDYFKIKLDEGDSLYVGMIYDGARGDLDLMVYDSWGQILATSASGQNAELCAVHKAPAPGLYYIRVFSSQGRSWYDLLIGRRLGWSKTAARRWTQY